MLSATSTYVSDLLFILEEHGRDIWMGNHLF